MSVPTYIRSSPRLPQLRLINAVVVLARIAARHGIDTQKLLAGSGIEIPDLDDPQKLITIPQEMTVARNMIKRVRVPWIGLEIGQEYHFGANGKLGMAMMCSETVIDALKLVLSHIHLTASYHQFTVKIKNGRGTAHFRELMDLGDARPFVCESEIASLSSMVRLGAEDIPVFKELRFAYPRPSYASKYEDIFGCPIKFGATEHRILFDARVLLKPLKFANPLVRTTLEKECDQLLARLQEQATLTARIHQELSLVQGGFPTLDQLARRINLSPRTLRRRLREEQTSYNHILADIRKDKAVELLKTTRLSMEKVAMQLGFREVSSFYRAFKGWTGYTPNSFREKNS